MVGEYFDPNYPARVEGMRLGHVEGYQAGQDAGYNHGFAAGHQSGWDAAVAACNVEMTKQLAYTRQHVDRIASLTAQINQLADLLKKSLACVQDAETEQARLKRMLIEKDQHVSALGAENVWRYNKIMVCFIALREAADELLSSNKPERNSMHASMLAHYETQVHKALERGAIRIPMDQDESFAKALPKTHQFLIKLRSYREQPSTPE